MADTSKMFLSTPPSGTNPYVQSLYHVRNADMVLDAAKISRTGIIKISSGLKKADVFISKAIAKKLQTSGLRKVVYGALKQSGEVFSKNLAAGLMKGGVTAAEKTAEKAAQQALTESAEQIAKKEGIPLAKAAEKAALSASGKLVAKESSTAAERVAITAANDIVKKKAEQLALKYGVKAGTMLARMGTTAATLAATLGPIGLVVDAVLMSLQVFGLIYELFDKSGLSTVMGPGEIKDAISQLVQDEDSRIAEAGVPGYYSEEAEFPVTDLIFQWDSSNNSYVMTPEWGPMYNGFLDAYMKSQGFGSDWRTLLDAAEPVSSLLGTETKGGTASTSGSGPSSTLVLILLILVIVVLTGVGLIFFLMD